MPRSRCAGEEAELQQRDAAALERGNSAAAARFRAELAALAEQQLHVKMGACAAIHGRMNEHSFGFETVDLHGQHAEHAADVVRHVVRCNTVERPHYRCGAFLVFFITGRGLHRWGRGGRVRLGQGRVSPAVADRCRSRLAALLSQLPVSAPDPCARSGAAGPVLHQAVMRELERHGIKHELLMERGAVCATFHADADALSARSDTD